MRCRPETRTWKQRWKLLWQRLYLRNRFMDADGCITKRKLVKALRNRLDEMAQAEIYVYAEYYYAEKGVPMMEKLRKRNRPERLMIISILGDMYRNFTGPEYLGTE